MKKTILYLITFMAFVFAIKVLHSNKNSLNPSNSNFEIQNKVASFNYSISNSSLNSLSFFAEVEDEDNDHELKLFPVLTNSLKQIFCFVNSNLHSKNYSKFNSIGIYGLPIFKAVRNFRL